MPRIAAFGSAVGFAAELECAQPWREPACFRTELSGALRVVENEYAQGFARSYESVRGGRAVKQTCAVRARCAATAYRVVADRSACANATRRR